MRVWWSARAWSAGEGRLWLQSHQQDRPFGPRRYRYCWTDAVAGAVVKMLPVARHGLASAPLPGPHFIFPALAKTA